jgi:GMP synthase-like glutamine amidotransferase
MCATTLACADKSPAVACDWGRGWCTTQFHPEASSQWFSECVTGGLIAPPEIGYSTVGDDAGKVLIANWLRNIVNRKALC